jgi:hypothetical protein
MVRTGIHQPEHVATPFGVLQLADVAVVAQFRGRLGDEALVDSAFRDIEGEQIVAILDDGERPRHAGTAVARDVAQDGGFARLPASIRG